MKCPNCNFEIPENTKFCPECGMKLPGAESKEGISEVTEIKVKGKKKKNKPMIIIISIASAIIFVCGIIFWLMQNPFCLFYHGGSYSKIIKEATCTEKGLKDVFCTKCDKFLWSEAIPLTGHEFEKGDCGVPQKCTRCEETRTLQHELQDSHCKHCDKFAYTVTAPSEVTVADYGRGRINAFSQFEVEEGYYGLRITFTALCMYSEDKSVSGSARFAYKLYSPEGTVVDSGTAYSDAVIKIGEKSLGSFEIYYSQLQPWTEYTLEIINIT